MIRGFWTPGRVLFTALMISGCMVSPAFAQADVFAPVEGATVAGVGFLSYWAAIAAVGAIVCFGIYTIISRRFDWKAFFVILAGAVLIFGAAIAVRWVRGQTGNGAVESLQDIRDIGGNTYSRPSGGR